MTSRGMASIGHHQAAMTEATGMQPPSADVWTTIEKTISTLELLCDDKKTNTAPEQLSPHEMSNEVLFCNYVVDVSHTRH